MKNEFEKLLDAIHSLESEKKELESELDKAKRHPSGQNSINPAGGYGVIAIILSYRWLCSVC